MALSLPNDPAKRRAYAANGKSGSKPVAVKVLETMTTTAATAKARTIEYTGIDAFAQVGPRRPRQRLTRGPRRSPLADRPSRAAPRPPRTSRRCGRGTSPGYDPCGHSTHRHLPNTTAT